jgi:hypothetical protein
MDWNTDAIDAARRALRTVNAAVDDITNKATQLESLLVLLAHTASSEQVPAAHLENACYLAADLARQIGEAAQHLR